MKWRFSYLSVSVTNNCNVFITGIGDLVTPVSMSQTIAMYLTREVRGYDVLLSEQNVITDQQRAFTCATLVRTFHFGAG